MFHAIGEERIEVVDLASDIIVYDIENNTILTTPLLKTEDFETFPSFSPDGKTLYFSCSTKQELPSDYKEIRYNLCKIDFNPENGAFGTKKDTLVWADKDKKSVSFARPSYDGKYIMYTLSDYGNFSIWHKEADLWLLDLQTGENRLLTEVNSEDTESYHSWSSNSRWFVFSSRRIDGLYTRPYIASIDETGKVSKPFLLPQKNPDYYLQSLYSFNIPEFVNGQVKLDASKLRRQLLSQQRK
jgi:Tol biopolymer transport system component